MRKKFHIPKRKYTHDIIIFINYISNEEKSEIIVKTSKTDTARQKRGKLLVDSGNECSGLMTSELRTETQKNLLSESP